MNKKLENLQEMQKFEAWKRQQTINDAFLPAAAAVAAGRALRKLGAAGKIIPRTFKNLNRTRQIYSGVRKNIRDVQSGKIVPRTSSGTFMNRGTYAQSQGQRILSAGVRTIDAAKRTIVGDKSIGRLGGISAAQSKLSALNRMAEISAGKGVMGTTLRAVTAIPRALVGGAIDSLKNKIQTYDPMLTSAQNRQNYITIGKRAGQNIQTPGPGLQRQTFISNAGTRLSRNIQRIRKP